jgi:hypothetical protein
MFFQKFDSVFQNFDSARSGEGEGVAAIILRHCTVLAIIVIVIVAAIVAVATIAAFADPKQKKKCPSHCIVQWPFSPISAAVT